MALLAVTGSLQAASSNDAFANAAPLPDSSGTVTGDSSGATREAGEPLETQNRTLWYSWTAPADYTATVSTLGTNAETVYLTIYHGDALDNLNFIASQRATGNCQIAFLAAKGVTYRVAVGFANTTTSNGTTVVNLATSAYTVTGGLIPPLPPTTTRPANDAIANAQELPAAGGSALAYSANATRENGERAESGKRSLWYSWTAPADAEVTVTNAGSTNTGSFDGYIAVYHGDGLATMNLVGTDSPQNSVARVTFLAAKDCVYRIAVGSGSDSTSNGVTLLGLSTSAYGGTGSLVAPLMPETNFPVNDSFATAQTFPAAGGVALGYNADATRENGERPETGQRTLWYSWTAPADVVATFSTRGTYTPYSYDVQLAVYQGDTLPDLNLVSSISVGPGVIPATLIAAKGTTYRIAVGFNNTSTSLGLTVLNLAITPFTGGTLVGPATPSSASPANDNLAKAQVLPPQGGTAVGYSANASRENGEGAGTGNRTLWYAWTAPDNVLVNLTTTGSVDSNNTLSVYQGDSLDSLNLVAQSETNAPSSASFLAVRGATYRIAIGAYSATTSTGMTIVNLETMTSDLFFGQVFGPPNPTTDRPANNRFIDAQPLLGTQLTAIGYPANADVDPGDPMANTSGISETLWYSFTATQTGTVSVGARGTSFDHQVGVYTGTSAGGLSPVTPLPMASLSGSAGRPANFRFAAHVGTTYYLELGCDSTGTTVLTVDPGAVYFGGGGTYAGFVGGTASLPLLKLTYGAKGALTGSLTVDGQAFTFKGHLAANGSITLASTTTNPTYSLTLGIDPTGKSRQISGSLTIGDPTMNSPVSFALDEAQSDPDQAGQYTALMAPATSASPVPTGSGFARVTVSTRGAVTIVGAMADGTVVSVGSTISRSGLCPISTLLYSGHALVGQLTGLLTFRDVADQSDFDGALTWTRFASAPGPAAYAGGFTAQTTIAGARFVPQLPLIGMPNQTFSLQATAAGGDLGSPISTALTVSGGARVTTSKANGFLLTFTKATGLISGTYTPPPQAGATKKPVAIALRGAVLQKQDRGGGYSVGRSQDGDFELAP